MIRAELLASARVPGDVAELQLHRRLLKQAPEYTIRIAGGADLMSSRRHSSEDALGELACTRLAAKPGSEVLVGGLGMGFTLAAALRRLRDDAKVTVVELVGEVVDWNRRWLGECAGHPLDDPRVTVNVGDVGDVIRQSKRAFDAIVLDVDNGPEALTHSSNAALYELASLRNAGAALREQGALLVWSSSADSAFVRRLRHAGFSVREHRVRAHGGKGSRHVIWAATLQ